MRKGNKIMKDFLDDYVCRMTCEEMYHDDFDEDYEDDAEDYRPVSKAPIGSYAWLMGY